MDGKEKCKILKELRKSIAASNGISYTAASCTHEGNCTGTCPQCDEELKYLDDQIQYLIASGVEVDLVGIANNLFPDTMRINYLDKAQKES